MRALGLEVRASKAAEEGTLHNAVEYLDAAVALLLQGPVEGESTKWSVIRQVEHGLTVCEEYLALEVA